MKHVDEAYWLLIPGLIPINQKENGASNKWSKILSTGAIYSTTHNVILQISYIFNSVNCRNTVI